MSFTIRERCTELGVPMTWNTIRSVSRVAPNVHHNYVGRDLKRRSCLVTGIRVNEYPDELLYFIDEIILGARDY